MIIVLVGNMGSGKSKLSKQLCKDLEFANFKFLEVSDLVKSLLVSKGRGLMVQESLQKKEADPMWLSNPLQEQLKAHKNWVVSGVREMVLLDAIRDLGQSVCVIHLQCIDKVRLKRCKDNHRTLAALKRADEIDSNLGLPEVINNADCTLNTAGTFKSTRTKLLDLVESFGGMD